MTAVVRERVCPEGAGAYYALDRWAMRPVDQFEQDPVVFARFLEEVRESLCRGGWRLLDPEGAEPAAGWVQGPFRTPCREFTDGARPAWIWWAAR